MKGLSVIDQTDVGWDEHTPPNETVDANGNPFPSDRGFGVADPRAPKRRVYNDPDVQALREHLRQSNGIRSLEICRPDDIERIARIYHRDGFVVVRDLLNTEQLNRFREGCARVLAQILEIGGTDGRKYTTETGRLPHRYSYGTSSASRQLMHDSTWTSMIDLPTTTPILTGIFGSADYRVFGGGGDVCLPGAIEYQHLHADGSEPQVIPEGRAAQAKLLGVDVKEVADTSALDLHTQRLIMELTPPFVTINFLMSDATWENGPIRQIPGSHTSRQSPPTPEDEPEWMRLSTLVGAPAGAGVIRDNRAWHGATPNLSRQIRAMPNIEYVPSWHAAESSRKTMPHEIWETLSPHAQRICRLIKAEPGIWPAGAGEMHPLASKRKALYKKGKEATSD